MQNDRNPCWESCTNASPQTPKTPCLTTDMVVGIQNLHPSNPNAEHKKKVLNIIPTPSHNPPRILHPRLRRPRRPNPPQTLLLPRRIRASNPRSIILHPAADAPRLVALLARDVPGRGPLGRRPRLDARVGVHEVDVLEAEGAGLVEEEPDEQGGGDVAADKDEAVGEADAVGGEGGEEADEDCRGG